jgi:hypothetical protein
VGISTTMRLLKAGKPPASKYGLTYWRATTAGAGSQAQKIFALSVG